MIEGWVESRFRHSPVAEELRGMLKAREEARPEKKPSAQNLEPYEVEGHAGGFFVFTSNVDAHHFDWFRANEIRECHGNTEIYQCAKEDGCPGVWRCPLEFGFRVDPSTMLAPTGEASDAGVQSDVQEDKQTLRDPDVPPRIGHVRGGGRPHRTRYMPGAPAAESWPNHPVCKHCGGPARPAILMFGDDAWQDCDMQQRRYRDWVGAACKLAQARETGGPDGFDRPLHVVVLEIGAGDNVTTVRSAAERTALGLHDAGAQVRLVRVNPELPLGDSLRLAPGGDREELVVSILGRGLETLHKIQAAMSAAA